jgi:DNA repair exonuclease SbcCD ATPase subunit
MHVKHIEVSNFKNIEHLEQSFNGDVYFFRGDNEVGKSSLMEAIFLCVTGMRHNDMLRQKTEKGYIKALIEGEKGEYEVELRFTEANPRGTIKVTHDGFKVDTQSALQGIFKYEDFDASEFIALSQSAQGRRKQVETIRTLLTKEEQKAISDYEQIIFDTKEERKGLGKEVDFLAKSLNKLAVGSEMLKKYTTPFVMANLLTELEQEQNKQAEIDKLVLAIRDNECKLDDWAAYCEQQGEVLQQALQSKVEKLKDWPGYVDGQTMYYAGKVADLEKEQKKDGAEIEELWRKLKIIERRRDDRTVTIKEAKQALVDKKDALAIEQETLKQEVNQASIDLDDKLKEEKTQLVHVISQQQKQIDETPAPKVDEVKEKIDNAEKHNEHCKSVSEYKELERQHKEKVAELDEYNAKIDKAQEEKQKVIEASNIPVEGLTFDEDGLQLKGVPFVSGKVSTSQEMEVAIRIIMAKNQTTKMIRIARGESLGGPKLQALINFARENGYQSFYEQVVPFKNELEVWEYTEAGEQKRVDNSKDDKVEFQAE